MFVYESGRRLAKTIVNWAKREERSELDWYVPTDDFVAPGSSPFTAGTAAEKFLYGLFDGLDDYMPKGWDWRWEWADSTEGFVVIRKGAQ